MMRRVSILLTAATVLAAATACSGGGPASSSPGTAFDPQSCQGGTLYILDQTSATDEHFDPARIYTSGGGAVPSLVFRTLTTRKRVPGQAGTTVAPDLATDTGTPSDDARTWTYHLRDGLKFEDGTPITSKDVKWGVERSFAPELPGGIPYLRDWLVGGADYKGPYKGEELDSIQTPDDKTIVFKLRKPEGDFPYVATATQFTPVPKAKDGGTAYERHPVSSGPYKVQTHVQDKSLTLVRNPNWSRAVDDQRLACPDRIEATYGLSAAVINQRLSTSAGKDADAITTDTDLSPAELARISTDPNLKKRTVRGRFGYTNFIAFNTKVKPFDDVRVRQAISYAVDRQAAVNAVGGSSLATPATTFLPDQAAFGYQPYDAFPAGPTGNPAKAKELLAQAGLPNLTITLAHRNNDANQDGPAVATAVQEALKQAGVTVRLKAYDQASYRSAQTKPSDEPGVFLSGWGADWPTGGPFLAPIFDGRQILKDGGNYNFAQYDDPKVNAEFDAINKISDPLQARPRWGALDAELGRQALTVPLFHPIYLRLYGKNVKNTYLDEWRGSYDVAMVSVK
ncbi:ABC transporter substrate-binding protein [Actinoallomurus spadix]|uniref:ABC transporter substrate-binding protein n=1 Tax=Actinoallomurus spadix TaxID=79912 RepID=A0ABN0X2Z0_9ACTN|nr:ABC transporter substrate-binding protein [Actinoallomurus spadix]MCO5989461.1 ABC transporter substrate-binding protein [Actinoallomurus spadix]